jgi:predicted kinase
MTEPAIPRRLEAEVERLYLNDEYEFLTVTLRLGDGRRLTLDFERDSELARELLEVLAEHVPTALTALDAAEPVLTRFAPLRDAAVDEEAP